MSEGATRRSPPRHHCHGERRSPAREEPESVEGILSLSHPSRADLGGVRADARNQGSPYRGRRRIRDLVVVRHRVGGGTGVQGGAAQRGKCRVSSSAPPNRGMKLSEAWSTPERRVLSRVV